MKSLTELKKGYLKVFLWLLFTLFLVPVITLVFAEYGNAQLDQQYTQFFMNDAQEQRQDTGKLQTFLQQNPPRRPASAVRSMKICRITKMPSAHRNPSCGSST